MKTINIDSNFSNIISLLTGNQFYDSDEIFLRELIANAYDACYTRQALEWSWGTEFLELEEAEKVNSIRKSFDARVVISYHSETGMLFVEDNGIGINSYDLEQYVANIGSSFYRSKQFEVQQLKYEPIAQFGIGLCSCFRVSRAILIESKKDKSINTAWNIMERQSLEPIAAKWFKDADHIEYITSNRETSGTRITLALEPRYAMKMSMSGLVKAVSGFMACQPIPIDIYFDNKKTTLNKPHMDIDPSAYVAGITTLQVDNELMEGYITLYNSKHEHLVPKSELFQQNFRLLEDVENIGLKPEWLRHMAFRLNLKKKLLNLKVTRDAVADDEKKKQLREIVGKLIIGYFQKNPLGLSQYLVDGRNNILTEYENEMKLLEQAAFVHIYLKEQELELTIGTLVQGFLGQQIQIAYISRRLFDYFKEHYPVEFKSFLSKYQLIVFEKNREMFSQMLAPYIKSMRYKLTELPGIVYTEVVADIHMRKSLSPFCRNYKLYPAPKVDDLVFCFVSNEQNGPFQIVLNENHRNTQLLASAISYPKVANLREVIIENIKQRIINSHNHWDRIIDFGGSFVDEWNPDKIMTAQAVWCLEDDFAQSLNAFIASKLTDVERNIYGLDGLIFHKDDFIDWWYMPK